MDKNEQALWQQLAAQDAAGNTEQAQLLAQQIQQYRQANQATQPAKQAMAQQVAAQEAPHQAEDYASLPDWVPEPVRQAADAGRAFSNSMADSLTFGVAPAVGNYLGSQVNALMGGNADQYRQERAALDAQNARQHPVASGAGNVAGMGAQIAAGAAVAPGMMAARAGQPVANVAKAAALGGGAAGLTTATHGGDARDIAGSAAAGAVAGPIVGKATELGMARLAPAAKRAWKLIAKKMGVSPDDLAAYAQQFKATTGENPSVAQLMNAEGSGALRAFSAQNSTMAAGMQAAARQADDALPGAVTRAIDAAGQPKAPAFLAGVSPTARSSRALANQLDDSMDKAMAGVADDAVSVPMDLIEDPFFQRALPRSMRRKLSEELADAGDDVDDLIMSVRDIDTVRRRLRRMQNSPANLGEDYGSLADELADTAAQQSKGYATALDEYGKGARFIEGFEHSIRGGASAETASNAALRRSLGTAEGKAGQQAGVLVNARNQAQSSPQGAASLADDLAGSTSRAKEFADAAPAQGGQMTRERAQMLSAGRESQQRATPSSVNPNVSEADAATHALVGAGEAVAGLHFAGVGRMMRAASRVFNSMELPEKAQREMAQALTSTDPAVVQNTIKQLRDAGANAAALKRLASVVSAETGVKTGEFLSPRTTNRSGQ